MNTRQNIQKQVESKVKQTIKKFRLFSKKDRIFVAVSGGKDSTSILYILKKLGYKPEALTINSLIGNYSKGNLENIKEFCKEQRIKLHVVSLQDEFGYSLCYIKSILDSKGLKLGSCAICGVLRRYLINKKARELKATKIVTGHNMDDECQAILMNLLKNNLEMLARLGPKTGIISYKGFVQRVKPLYFVSEKEIVEYSRALKFPVKYSRCPCSSNAFRNKFRELLNRLEKENPKLKQNIINYFLKIEPKLSRSFSATSKTPDLCIQCSEPSRDNLCMSCQIISKIKS